MRPRAVTVLAVLAIAALSELGLALVGPGDVAKAHSTPRAAAAHHPAPGKPHPLHPHRRTRRGS